MRALLKIEHSHLLRGLYRSSASWLLRMRGNQPTRGRFSTMGAVPCSRSLTVCPFSRGALRRSCCSQHHAGELVALRTILFVCGVHLDFARQRQSVEHAEASVSSFPGAST